MAHIPYMCPGTDSTTALRDRLDGLLRHAARARCVQNLVIGPVTWQWDADLLQKMIYVWAAVPLLSELTFDVAHNHFYSDLSSGEEFAPVLRGLLYHGTHIRLHSFTYKHHMTPNSPLERFLAAQPSIQCLFGIHSRWRRCPTITPALLPGLRAISGDPRLTARLLPSRPLVSINCTAISRRDAEKILDVIEESSPRLVFISLKLSTTFASERIAQRVVQTAPGLRMMDVRDPTIYRECHNVIEKLVMLEDLVCNAPTDNWNRWDPGAFSRWLPPHGPRLKRVVFFTCSGVRVHGGVWERGEFHNLDGGE